VSGNGIADIGADRALFNPRPDVAALLASPALQLLVNCRLHAPSPSF
jgi:hypothetical protein